MSDALFWLLMIAGPIPAVWIGRRLRAWRDARLVRNHMAERRARFAGAIRKPGSAKVERIER